MSSGNKLSLGIKLSRVIELSRGFKLSRGIKLSRGNPKCRQQAGYITKEYQYKPDDAEAINQRVVIKYINEVRDRANCNLMTSSQFDDVILDMYSYFLFSRLGSQRRLIYHYTRNYDKCTLYFLVKQSNDDSLSYLSYRCKIFYVAYGFTDIHIPLKNFSFHPNLKYSMLHLQQYLIYCSLCCSTGSKAR